MAANLTVHNLPGRPIAVMVGGKEITGILELRAVAHADGPTVLHMAIEMDGTHAEWLHTAPPAFATGGYVEPKDLPPGVSPPIDSPPASRYPFGDPFVPPEGIALLSSLPAAERAAHVGGAAAIISHGIMEDNPQQDGPGNPGGVD